MASGIILTATERRLFKKRHRPRLRNVNGGGAVSKNKSGKSVEIDALAGALLKN